MPEQERAGRVAVTKQRHGDDFYRRIGRMGQALSRRASGGDASARVTLATRRAARERRGGVWLEVVAAQEAVTLLREELLSRARADAEPARALLGDAFAYNDRLRRELYRAEERLAACRAAHQQLLRDLTATPEETAPASD